MANKRSNGLADPTKLKPINKRDETLQVIIETPKGSPNKFAFDPKQRIFVLKAVLPAGMVFPYDFGFLPQTLAPDGDPIDVLLLMDEPVYPGCAVNARLIGVIEGEQIDGKKRIRNDRLLAVAEANHTYAYLKKLKDLPSKTLRELQDFFVNYHRLEGKEYRLLGCKGTEAALSLIHKAQKAFRPEGSSSGDSHARADSLLRRRHRSQRVCSAQRVLPAEEFCRAVWCSAFDRAGNPGSDGDAFGKGICSARGAVNDPWGRGFLSLCKPVQQGADAAQTLGAGNHGDLVASMVWRVVWAALSIFNFEARRMIVAAGLAHLKGIKPHEWALRFVFGGLCTMAAGLIAERWGPAVGGLFLAFPAIFPASASLIEQHEMEHKRRAGMDGTIRGRMVAGVDAAGASIGAIGLVAFAAVVWKALPGYQGSAIGAATTAWLVVSTVLWLLRKRRLLRRR